MIRVYKKFTPSLIARHVRTLYRGRFSVEGFGTYEFDRGGVVLPRDADKRSLDLVTAVNREIKRSKVV